MTESPEYAVVNVAVETAGRLRPPQGPRVHQRRAAQRAARPPRRAHLREERLPEQDARPCRLPRRALLHGAVDRAPPPGGDRLRARVCGVSSCKRRRRRCSCAPPSRFRFPKCRTASTSHRRASATSSRSTAATSPCRTRSRRRWRRFATRPRRTRASSTTVRRRAARRRTSRSLRPKARSPRTTSTRSGCELVTENAERLGLDNLTVGEPEGEYDVVLVDAPCSNTGVLARRPEARWRVKEKHLRGMAERQLSILKAASAYREAGRSAGLFDLQPGAGGERRRGRSPSSKPARGAGFRPTRSRTCYPDKSEGDGGFMTRFSRV